MNRLLLLHMTSPVGGLKKEGDSPLSRWSYRWGGGKMAEE